MTQRDHHNAGTSREAVSEASLPEPRPPRPRSTPRALTWLLAAGVVAIAMAGLGALAASEPGPSGVVVGSGESDALQSGHDQPENTSARAARVVTDSLGRRVEAPIEPKRIAALTAQAAEMLVDLGVKPILRPDSPHEPAPELRDTPTISIEHAAGPNLEQLVAAQPDLVISSSTFAQFIPSIESATEAPVLTLDVRSVADIKDNARLLGELLKRSAQAESLIEAIDASVARTNLGGTGVPPVAGRAAPTEAPKVFALFGAPSAFYAFLPETYLGDLVDIAGGRLIAVGESSDSRYRGFAPIGMESLLAADPDCVLTVAHSPSGDAGETKLDSLRADPAWSSLRAVREGCVVSLPERLYVTAAGARFEHALRLVREALDRIGEGR